MDHAPSGFLSAGAVTVADAEPASPVGSVAVTVGALVVCFASPSYAAFTGLGENGTGLLMGGLGLGWLVGLIINGAKPGPTSTLRIACAAVGSVIYGLMGIGFFLSFLENGILNAGVPICFLVSGLTLYSLYWIAIDKREHG